jgi:hypothetical protein
VVRIRIKPPKRLTKTNKSEMGEEESKHLHKLKLKIGACQRIHGETYLKTVQIKLPTL